MEAQMTIVKNGLQFDVDKQTDAYGQNRVVAHRPDCDETVVGEIPGIPQRAYPRIEFLFKTAEWLHAAADSSGWILGDYETDEECRARKPDSCTFVLTQEQADEITRWRFAPQPQPRYASSPIRAEPIEPIFGIGCLNVGDGAEMQVPWPALGQVCSRCGAAESHGAMFTTLAGSGICDDCTG